jgi:hypothetical protein
VSKVRIEKNGPVTPFSHDARIKRVLATKRFQPCQRSPRRRFRDHSAPHDLSFFSRVALLRCLRRGAGYGSADVLLHRIVNRSPC